MFGCEWVTLLPAFTLDHAPPFPVNTAILPHKLPILRPVSQNDENSQLGWEDLNLGASSNKIQVECVSKGGEPAPNITWIVNNVEVIIFHHFLIVHYELRIRG